MIEEKLILKEIEKRKKLKLEWKYHQRELFKPEKISFNQKEIKLIKDLLYTKMSRHRRKDYWFIASGAKREMLNNKGYYQSLLNNFPKGTQSPSEKVIELDVPRTFPSDPFFKEDNTRKKLSNILTAFVRRNSTIGYSQGLNCIAGKLLKVVENEEETFWIFTQIIENYLPGDFYLLFTGVRKDVKVIEEIIKSTLTYCNQTIMLSLNNLISKTFISLFSRGMPEQITFQIWDAFFIYGEIVLYRTFIWIAFLLCNKSLVNKDIEEISSDIGDKMKGLEENGTLSYFLFMYDAIDYKSIRKWKKLMELKMDNEMFLHTKSMNTKKIECDKTLPVCLYSNEENDIAKNSKFIIHRMNKEIHFYDNYFFEEINKKKDMDDNGDDNKDDLNISENSILIQRQIHKCQDNN